MVSEVKMGPVRGGGPEMRQHAEQRDNGLPRSMEEGKGGEGEEEGEEEGVEIEVSQVSGAGRGGPEDGPALVPELVSDDSDGRCGSGVERGGGGSVMGRAGEDTHMGRGDAEEEVEVESDEVLLLVARMEAEYCAMQDTEGVLRHT